MAEIQVRALDPADRCASIDVLMDAFQSDPWMAWCFLSEEPGYRERMRGYCETGHHWHTTLGFPVLAGYAGDQVVAVAYVMGPDPQNPDGEPPLLPAMRKVCGERAVERFARCNAATEAKMPEAPAHCIALIAVREANQGRRIGSQLLGRVIADAEADPASAGIVLETGNPKNLGFYGRHGFEVVGETRVESLDLSVLFRACRKETNR